MNICKIYPILFNKTFSQRRKFSYRLFGDKNAISYSARGGNGPIFCHSYSGFGPGKCWFGDTLCSIVKTDYILCHNPPRKCAIWDSKQKWKSLFKPNSNKKMVENRVQERPMSSSSYGRRPPSQ